MDLEREAGLRRAVTTLGTARRLVREGASALEVIARDIVGHRLQCARVVRARNPVGAVGATVEQRAKVHARDCAVALHTGAYPHQRRVTAAMTVENLFARQR